MEIIRKLGLFIWLCSLAGCIEPFQVDTPETDLLVIDGFVNATTQTATVKLTRAVSMAQNNFPPELGAVVSLEKEGGAILLLPEEKLGMYALSNINVKLHDRYRLRIRTADRKTYFSDLVEVMPSGKIDSVTWKGDAAGVKLSVFGTGGPGSSRYYRWHNEETWEYRSSFLSNYQLVNGVAKLRMPEEKIHTCWTIQSSTQVLTRSTVQLSKDIIYDFPIAFVPASSDKLGRRYSLLVKQYGISKEHFEFLKLLARTTEEVGGLFDTQPGSTAGNIKSGTGSEVLGYFSAAEETQQRIFIEYYDLPDEILDIRRYRLCDEADIGFIPLAELYNVPPSTLLIEPVSNLQGILVGYSTADPICIDCRLQGGTTVRPEFW